MFAFLLIMCTPVHGGVQCLPPQEYKTLETCQRVGQSYRKAMVDAYAFDTARFNPRCVQVKK